MYIGRVGEIGGWNWKIERIKGMCEYCNESYLNKNMSTDKYCEISIIDNDIEIDYEKDFGYTSMYYKGTIHINYCPMCGRKL